MGRGCWRSVAKVSIIVLLYNAGERVDALVESVINQRDPAHEAQSDWLDILFMDDCSRDDTHQRLQNALVRIGSPGHIKVVRNERNLGLSQTLNKAFSIITTPYGLTCHLDVLFGQDDYVTRMVSLMDTTPRAAVITGQPTIPAAADMPLAEKFNIIANMMDVLPPDTREALIPVGFAEGRCDMFRVEGLKKVGFWDTTLFASGEDQILAARLRQHGYELFQAPSLKYILSVSEEQNSLKKLLRHAHLFGRTQPYIFVSSRRALAGGTGASAGENRQSRLMLRATHLAGAIFYCITIVTVTLGLSPWVPLVGITGVFLFKGFLLRRYLRVLPLKLREFCILMLFVPLQDLCYTAGIVQGVWSCFRKPCSGPIQ